MTQLNNKNLDLTKACQMVFFFLDKANKSDMHVTKLRLIKWLYLAERESYKEFGEPMIGDRLASLKHGPVPSETLAIIEGNRKENWGNIISVDKNPKHQYVKLVRDCIYSSQDDLDRFSEAEIGVLESIWAKYGSWSAVQLEKHLHDTSVFPEWQWKEGDGTNWIQLETILGSVGFSDDEINSMVPKIIAFNFQQAA